MAEYANNYLRLAVAICGLTMLASLARAGQDTSLSAGDHEFEFRHDKRTRYYLLHVPPQHDPARRMALVMVLHGGGGDPHNAVRMTGMSEKADKEGFMVVYPYGSGFFHKRVLTWNAANCCGFARRNQVDDVGFIAALLDTLLLNYNIDPARIYVTGISNGGMMAFRLGCELADKIAAIAPVAASFNDESCQPASPVSVVMFNGTLDDRVLYDGGIGKGREQRVDRPVADAIVFWVTRNHCNVESILEKRGKIAHEVFPSTRSGAGVELYTIHGGGHAWPGGHKGYLFGDEPTRQLSATDVMWDFFKSHPKVHTAR